MTQPDAQPLAYAAPESSSDASSLRRTWAVVLFVIGTVLLAEIGRHLVAWVDSDEWWIAHWDDRIPMIIQLALGGAGGWLTIAAFTWWRGARVGRSIAICALVAWTLAEAMQYAYGLLFAFQDGLVLQDRLEWVYLVLQLVGGTKAVVVAALVTWLFMRTTRRFAGKSGAASCV